MEENKKYEGFSLAMALVDALPVIFFGCSSVVIGLLFKSTLFIIGAVLVFLAGFLKVTWKLILATAKKDIQILNKQMRAVMPAGFLVIILSVVLGLKRISLPAIWTSLIGAPQCIFFILCLLCMTTMGILAKKLDSRLARSNWIEQSVNTLGQLSFLIGLLIIL